MTSKPILCVGLVCVDVVNLVETFPIEDTDTKTVDQWRTRGGNASNNCTVLSQLGFPCQFLGSLAMDEHLAFIKQDFQKHNIEFGKCAIRSGFPTPNSCIIVNKYNGSRTILHTNLGLPELTPDEFSNVCIKDFSWIHFEGRNVGNVSEMAKYVRKFEGRPKISLEAEKLGRDYSVILPYVDVVFVSKELSISKGADSKLDVVSNPVRILGQTLNPKSMIICAWGDRGAAARDHDGNIYDCDAITPAGGKIVETIGAGDTLVATVVACLANKMSIKDAISTGCRVAGNKVGQIGFSGLGKYF